MSFQNRYTVRISSYIVIFLQFIWRDRRTFFQSYCALFLFQAARLEITVRRVFMTEWRRMRKRMNFSSNVPYRRSVLCHIRLSDFTQYILSESFNATNNILVHDYCRYCAACSLLNWIYRVFINYTTAYMPVQSWIFLLSKWLSVNTVFLKEHCHKEVAFRNIIFDCPC